MLYSNLPTARILFSRLSKDTGLPAGSKRLHKPMTPISIPLLINNYFLIFFYFMKFEVTCFSEVTWKNFITLKALNKNAGLNETSGMFLGI